MRIMYSYVSCDYAIAILSFVQTLADPIIQCIEASKLSFFQKDLLEDIVGKFRPQIVILSSQVEKAGVRHACGRVVANKSKACSFKSLCFIHMSCQQKWLHRFNKSFDPQVLRDQSSHTRVQVQAVQAHCHP